MQGSDLRHMYAWPRHIKFPEVEDVFQNQLESDNTEPFKIEARCVECNVACAPVQVTTNLTSIKWAGPKPGYRSVCYCGLTDFLPKQNVEQFNLSGIVNKNGKTPTQLACEYCQIGKFPHLTFPFAACKFCGASPSYHHGRCCIDKPLLRPHSLRSDLGSSLSANSVKTDKRVGVFVVDSQHSED